MHQKTTPYGQAGNGKFHAEWCMGGKKAEEGREGQKGKEMKRYAN